jgi:hypothetical protein
MNCFHCKNLDFHGAINLRIREHFANDSASFKRANLNFSSIRYEIIFEELKIILNTEVCPESK